MYKFIILLFTALTLHLGKLIDSWFFALCNFVHKEFQHIGPYSHCNRYQKLKIKKKQFGLQNLILPNLKSGSINGRKSINNPQATLTNYGSF